MQPRDQHALAIAGLAFIANDEKLLARFLSLTGIKPLEIREAARAPGFLAAVLHFIVAHEPTLMEFCQHGAHNPKEIVAAEQWFALSRQEPDRSSHEP